MKDWNASLYLRFSGERTQPATDLAAALTVEQPTRVLDVGCGPGNSTAVLVGRFPGSEVVGIDSSPAMLEQARTDCPAARFELCDVSCQLSELAPDWDVIFSNALSDEDKPAFEADIFAGLTEEYPLQQNREILFPFPRFFFLVTK